jgi:S-adenosylmethionine synthetase
MFTSESVFPGHPDRICDQISDSILDYCIEYDSESRVAVETMVCPDRVIVAGEITTKADIDYEYVARETVKSIGYVHDGLGFRYDTFKFVNHIHQQSPDISMGVNTGGAGDNGLIFGGACRETDSFMPLSITICRTLERNFRRLCFVKQKEFGVLFRPDGKSQVTIDQTGKNPIVKCVVFNVQTTENAEKAGEYRELITKLVIKPTLESFNLNTDCVIYINPTGKFVVGGPFGDCGVTGRKIIAATYGGYYRHGGGAQSGKDPTKVDKSAVMMARYIAKNIVAAEIANDVEVQLGYAIGIKQPVSLLIYNRNPNTKIFKPEILSKVVLELFDCSVDGIKSTFKLCDSSMVREFLYSDCAAFGYVGDDVEKETGFALPWERIDKVNELKELYCSCVKNTGYFSF